MKFEYPQVFFAFFLLVIPIIIHLFNFRKYKTLYFSSLRFVKQVNEETKSTQKLKHYLVLLARLLAFSALILAFAQPYSPISENTKSGYPFLGIYLDNSFSMTLKGSEGELISMAKEKARKIIEKVAPETRIMLVTNDFKGFEQRLSTKTEILDRIDKIEASPLIKNLDDVINWMQEGISKSIDENQNLGSKQIILLSDFQKNSSRFDKLIPDKDCFYYSIQFVPQEKTNISIDSIWFFDPNFKQGINNELSIKVSNQGEEDLVNSELRLEVNEIKRAIFFDLKKKESSVLTINYSDQKSGIKKGKVSVNDKQMHFDDDYYFSYEVKENSKVLIVNGESSVANIGLVYKLDDYYESQTVEQNSFTANKLNEIDLLVLNGVNFVSTAAQEAILNFCNRGGNCALFPGEKLDFSNMNSFLLKMGSPTFNGIIKDGTKIQELNYTDPFFAGMFEKKPTNLNLPSQNQVYKVSGRNMYNLIKIQNSSPLFYKILGKNSFFVFTSCLKPSFGNFTSNALFSSILLRIAETSQRRYPLSLEIGSEAKFPLYKVPNSEKVLKLKSKNLEFIPQVQVEKDLTTISINKSAVNQSLLAGFYDIVKDETIAYLALNYMRDESKIAHLSEDEIKAGFNEKGIEKFRFSTLTNESDSALIKIEKPEEYWRIFILLVIFFLLVEMSLLKWLK
jgi:hypothetical protein